MRWLVVHPGPNFSVADVHAGWMEALAAAGETVAEFNMDRRLQFYSSALLETGNRDATGHPEVKQALNREQAITMASGGLMAACYQVWPEAILITSAFFTPPWLLQVMRARRHKLVALFTESPYQDDMQLDVARYCDAVILNDPTNIDRYRDVCSNVMYAPHAYRPKIHSPGPAVAELECDLAFVGTGYPSRIKFFEAMNLDGLDLVLAGNWTELDDGSPLMRHIAHELDECFDNEQIADTYRSAKTGINIYRREAEEGHEGEGWSMGPREVEMAACGLFYLRDPRGEGDELLPMLPVFDGPADASEKLRWWLARPDQRATVAAAARAAVADRTFDNNVRALLRLLNRQPTAVA